MAYGNDADTSLVRCVQRLRTPLVLSLSKDELVVRQAHHERVCNVFEPEFRVQSRPNVLADLWIAERSQDFVDDRLRHDDFDASRTARITAYFLVRRDFEEPRAHRFASAASSDA